MSASRAIALLLFALAPVVVVGQSPDDDKVEVIKPPNGAPPPAPAPDLGKVAERIVARTNQFRKCEKQPDVTVNDKLTAAAREFSDYMARTGRYGHTADGKQPHERTTKSGYDHCLIAENIAYA